MAKLDHDGLIAAAIANLGAEVDPTGEADLLSPNGAIVVAADGKALKGAFKRAKKIDGFRWVLINRADLFTANPISLGSKAGIYDADGAILKAAAVPRKKM